MPSKVRASSSPGYGVAGQTKCRSFSQKQPGRTSRCLSCSGATAPSGQLQKRCTEEGPYLIPLPGGTLNMLSRALYGDVSWEDALKNTLAAPAVRMLSGGRVADKRFFIAAIVGAPSLWAEARESIREGEIVDAIKKGGVAFQHMFETKVQYLISEKIKGEAEAVAVICPLISEEMSDSEQALEAAVIDVESAAEVIGLATAAAFGKWRDDRNIILTKTKRVAVQSSKDIPAILDGERVNLGKSAEIDFVSRAVNVIVPAKQRPSGSRVVGDGVPSRR